MKNKLQLVASKEFAFRCLSLAELKLKDSRNLTLVQSEASS